MAEIQLIDSHCHLNWKSFQNDLPEVIDRAKKNGLVAVITSSIGPEIQDTLNIVRKFQGYVFFSLGLHPPQVSSKTVSKTIKLIKEHEKEIVAIGEVGLDYYWVPELKKREEQKKAFIQFIKLAIELDKTLVIHVRNSRNQQDENANDEAIRILSENIDTPSRVLMHCYSGNKTQTRKVVNLGWWISVPTSVTNRRVHQNTASITPLSQMVLETDAPFLAPKGYKRNEPAYVAISAEKIAELKNTSKKEVADATTKNAKKIYNLPI
ncbi:MAG: TatD family hydrolase [Candidatus Helarchaeota archaeon]